MLGWHRRLRPRQKLMAELLHQGLTPQQAYDQAGYAPSKWNPYTTRGLKHPKIQAYLRQLEERAMNKNDVTVQKILTDLERQKEGAEREGQYSAAINASMAQAKIVGLVVERREVKEVSDMDMRELAEAIRTELGDQADAVIKGLQLEEKEPEKWPDFPPTGMVQ